MKWYSFLLSLAAGVISVTATEKIQVVTLHTVLTDVVQNVGRDTVTVISLVQPGMDPHGFQPSPADLKKVQAAAVVLASGKGLENYLAKLKKIAGPDKVVDVGAAVPSLTIETHDPHGHDHDHGAVDPHWWQSIDNLSRATRTIRDALIKAAPAQKEFFTQNAAAYETELVALQKWARAEITQLPTDRRKLVTSHDALGYFARDYGFTIHAVEGFSPQDEPSSKKAAHLIDLIKKDRVKAIFAENVQNPKVLQEITRETGAVLGGELYTDSLGEGEASTYVGMFRHNVRTIVTALK